MHKRLLASVLGALTLLLALFTATAYADSSPPGVQTGSQTAGSGQIAAAGSGATQVNPSNTNIAVRVLSPGDDGSVSQTNSVSSNANATNSNSANQSSTQNGGGIQVGGQTATNDQLAAALSTANQYGATNTNTPVRVLSDGDGGSVTQSNDASSNATSSNTNGATQSAGQNGSSCGCAPSPPIAPATTSTAAPRTRTSPFAFSATATEGP